MNEVMTCKFDNILCVIPARGGSKRLQNKNVKRLGDKPLIGWTIDFARQSKIFDYILVSTDDANIAATAVEYAAEVPWLRPAELATDESTTIEVLRHALSWYCKEYKRPDAIVLLQPTSPFRNISTVRKMLELFYLDKSKIKSVASLSQVDSHPNWTFYECDGAWQPCMGWDWFTLRSQDLPSAARLDGSVYILSPDLIETQDRIIGDWTTLYKQSESSFCDIDTLEDFRKAEEILRINNSD
jgi:CMP-N,N'-diacetyllegionaminic acid synthase